MKNAIRLALAATLALAVTSPLTGCASCSRVGKTFESNTVGLNRKVTLYDNQGEVIQTWEGVISLDESDNEVLFDLDGKRVVIQGGITVIEEV